jgi:hypothetical protein
MLSKSDVWKYFSTIRALKSRQIQAVLHTHSPTLLSDHRMIGYATSNSTMGLGMTPSALKVREAFNVAGNSYSTLETNVAWIR